LIREMRAKVLAAGLVAIGALTVLVPAAGAGEPRFDDSNGGGLPTVSSFGSVTLDGTSQLTTATIAPFVVVDDSGTRNGWNVTLQVPDFRNGTGADCSAGATATIPANTLSTNAPVVAPADGQTSMTGVTSAGFTDFTSAQKIVVATSGHGDGTYTISPQLLKLTIPASARADSYCTLATIAIASGP
jgi:hypothetical protein